MTNTMDSTGTYAIDAAGKTLGRVASAAAKALMGKTSVSYTPHVDSRIKVTVSNASKIRIAERKRLSKTYTSYSGYPGGSRRETLAQLIERRGIEEALRKAVQRMLPRNTMLVSRMKHLVIIK